MSRPGAFALATPETIPSQHDPSCDGTSGSIWFTEYRRITSHRIPPSTFSGNALDGRVSIHDWRCASRVLSQSVARHGADLARPTLFHSEDAAILTRPSSFSRVGAYAVQIKCGKQACMSPPWRPGSIQHIPPLNNDLSAPAPHCPVSSFVTPWAPPAPASAACTCAPPTVPASSTAFRRRARRRRPPRWRAGRPWPSLG